MEDYYDGVEGGRRLIKEMDYFLQQVVNTISLAERLKCSIELRVTGGEVVVLEKEYQRNPDLDWGTG